MRKASFTAALSEGQPYSSLIRARASQSAASNRMVLAGVLCRSVIPQVYHIGRALTFTRFASIIFQTAIVWLLLDMHSSILVVLTNSLYPRNPLMPV